MKTNAALFLCALFAMIFGAPGAHASDLMTADQAVSMALAKNLDQNEEWLRLVHYRRLHFGRGLWSQAANPLFFLSPEGKRDPRAELIATLKLGFSGELLKPAMPHAPAMPVRCQYPARWKWLMKELGEPPLPKVDCPGLDEFKDKMHPRSATLVFSGYYVNNPSTVFGHTLIRLNRGEKHESTGAELLDFGLNYAANSTTENPVLYAVFGMTGLFKGSFAAVPYYFKVREYSDAQSRDLWEYDLNLTPEELERLTDHLWEMGSTDFNYFYFDENCAYQLLAVLEAAAPRLHLLDRIHFYVPPADAVKAIAEESGLVSAVRYRPSTQRQLEARYETLNKEEREAFLEVRDDDHPVARLREAHHLSPESEARVLDAVLDHIDYRFFHELVFKTDPRPVARKKEVLFARAVLPAGGEITVPFTERDRPDHSHASSRWSLGVGSVDDTGNHARGALDAEVRFSLHNITDPLDGYLPYSTVEFWRMSARLIPSESRVELSNFALFTVSSLAPLSRLEEKPAWRVSAGAERVRDRRCVDCLAAYGLVFGGGAIAPAQPLLLYALAGPMGEASPDFIDNKWLAALSTRAGFRWKWTHAFQLGAEAEWRRVFDLETFDKTASSWLARWDREVDGRAVDAVELDFTTDSFARDAILRYLRFF